MTGARTMMGRRTTTRGRMTRVRMGKWDRDEWDECS